MDDAPLYTLFWENSKLNPRTVREFAARLDEDARAAAPVAQLLYPAAPVPLARPDDALARLQAARASGRAFSPGPIDARTLGHLFHAVVRGASPSAGAKYPIELYALLFAVTHPLAGQIVYYDAVAHALQPVAACPPWDAIAGSSGLALDGAPAILFVLVAFPARVTGRYGERGGRLLLLECGHHAQQLGLRVAAEGLAGVEAGGLHDDPLRALLGLERTDAQLALGYAVGRPSR